jgi:tRNA threonylcarbamoyladenosine biosynthesis protein TsaB
MILGIDTSGQNLGLAICENGKVIASELTRPGLRHGEILQLSMDKFLSANGISLSGLSGISVTLGPGSFTGLRIGLAAAKGYCYGLDLPLTGISTLLANAMATTNNHKKTIVIIDAKRDEYYYAVFNCSEGHLQRLSPDQIGPIEDFRDIVDQKTCFLGPSHTAKQFIAEFGPSEYLVSDDLNLAESACLTGEQEINQGRILKPSEVVPIYLRSDF